MSKKIKNRNFNLQNIILAIICIGISIVANLLFKSIKTLDISLVEESGSGFVVAISPEKSDLTVGSESSFDININTNGNHVLAGIISLSYDPTKISIVSSSKGDFFEDELKTPTFTNGIITLVYGVPQDSIKGKAGSGKLASLRVKPILAGDSIITFTENFKLLPDVDVSADVDVSMNEVNIKAIAPVVDIPLPSPIPSPTPTPSPLASPSPSLSPDPSPTPTPTPTPTPSPTPSNLTTPPPVRKSSTPKSTSTPKPLVNAPAVVTPESIREFLPTNTPFDQSSSADQPIKSLGVTVQTSAQISPKPGVLQGLAIYIKKALKL